MGMARRGICITVSFFLFHGDLSCRYRMCYSILLLRVAASTKGGLGRFWLHLSALFLGSRSYVKSNAMHQMSRTSIFWSSMLSNNVGKGFWMWGSWLLIIY